MAHSGQSPPGRGGLEPSVQEVSQRARSEACVAGLLDQLLELCLRESPAAVDRPGRPPLPAGLGVSSQVQAELPGIPPPWRDPTPRSWTSHGQLMDKIEAWAAEPAKRIRWSAACEWSGRRDSNPRPPPWQKGRSLRPPPFAPGSSWLLRGKTGLSRSAPDGG
jgi:hypothetical protein